jgi:sugar lactone lactonase YvrE
VVETTTPAIWRFNNNNNAGLGVSFADKPSALRSIVFDANDNAFIADQASGRIYKWDSSSPAAPAIWNTGDAAASPGADATAVRFNNPSGLAIDVAGNMLVSETFAERVWLVEAATGKLGAVVGNGTPGRAVDAGSAAATQLRAPRGVAFVPGNTAYIADSLNNHVLKVLLEC